MRPDLADTLLRPEAVRDAPVLRLFGGPIVTLGSGRRLTVPEGSKRLLVFVALHQGRVDRRYAAGALWPIGDDERATGNLRSALWRLGRAEIDVILADKHSLILRPDVVIDLHVIGDWAARLIEGRATHEDLSILPSGVDALDLLPGWYDDWVLLERERIRQRLLHALDALSLEHRRAGRAALAVEAAMTAVISEPLRESAQRALIEAHLAEGNWVEGWRRYDCYRDLLNRELGVEPGPELRRLLGLTRERSGDAVGNRPRGPLIGMGAIPPGATRLLAGGLDG